MVSRRTKQAGFTLIEMLIVISVIMILLAVAVPNYRQSVLRARDSVLRQNLFTLRNLISEFTLDKQRAPQSLDDLVQSGYLKELPTDPCTGQKDWVSVEEDTLLAVDQQQPGIVDVHSNCQGNAADGAAYSSW
jgi:general secretion pathway protein G